jgi:3-oxoacid CoA-transferase subunit B
MSDASSSRERIAAAVARHLDDDTFVNVGIGIPGLVPHHVPDERGITFHAEHGVVGFGSSRFGPADGTPVAFFGTTYRLRPGAFVCDHTRSFALIRSGRLDATVLGAFQVGADGRFASYRSADMASGCPGGSPELTGAARRVIVATEHTDPDGRPKLVYTLTLPVGVDRPADLIVTELGAFLAAGTGFRIVELADGVSRADVEAATAAPIDAPLDGPVGEATP